MFIHLILNALTVFFGLFGLFGLFDLFGLFGLFGLFECICCEARNIMQKRHMNAYVLRRDEGTP